MSSHSYRPEEIIYREDLSYVNPRTRDSFYLGVRLTRGDSGDLIGWLKVYDEEPPPASLSDRIRVRTTLSTRSIEDGSEKMHEYLGTIFTEDDGWSWQKMIDRW